MITRKHRAFTLMEVLIVLIIFLVCASCVSLTPKILRRTAQQEAERVLHWLYHVTQRADRTGSNFDLVPNALDAGFIVNWKRSETVFEQSFFQPSDGFQFIFNERNTIHYSPQWGTFTPAMTLKVQDKNDKSFYYVIVSGQGQLRISQNLP